MPDAEIKVGISNKTFMYVAVSILLYIFRFYENGSKLK
ncbi:hypothetical protein THOM_3056 [Trachipleistophora hominis]|uniref:Uncharacterized protein n=1 Tax=Trachipleistophora hominis TaxID=72359 RepID=L7JRC9_TRAHO|nr:hypothetical protein THOM_3056 [Trachipleistophora hominis]